jgi:hypothetical protein
MSIISKIWRVNEKEFFGIKTLLPAGRTALIFSPGAFRRLIQF